jgi:L-ascorbate metabolism protein UlaG (beta-lactamase superfamily)
MRTPREGAAAGPHGLAAAPSPSRLTFVGHGTVLFEMDGARILSDPLLRAWCGPLKRLGPAPRPADYAALDAILISHLHLDHFDPLSFRKTGRALTLIGPPGMARAVRRRTFAEVVELAAGESTVVGTVTVKATPAAHEGGRYPGSVARDSIGFLVSGSHRVYYAGDTALFPEMAWLDEHLDVAMLPVSGWGPTLGDDHMTPQQAAEAATHLRARIAVPVHWGTFYPPGVSLAWRRRTLKAPHEFAAALAKAAPKVETVVLQPGEALSLDGG